ncbi:MAG: hypothetical protein N3G21_05040 [Candidatus Hydrogenedentes bacterium]|nr:hypothetical protein [Candidatus Hydrogenedentota bacterium]
MSEDNGNKVNKNMGKEKDTELRIYCICGQKMRVKPEMYGKPGRCVACRQKIKIPSREEIPGETKEIYLKDHPELLRKSSSKEKSIPLGDTTSDSGATPYEEPPDVLPLEHLEFLRYLISAEYKAQKHLDALRHRAPIGPETKSELMEYLSKIRRLRASLDEKLRNRRIELIEQSRKIEEEINKHIVEFRVGEINFETYWQLVTPLRLKREILTKRRRNVEGWLSIFSPELAGGYIDVDLKKLPEKVTEITFTLEDEEYESVLSMLIKSLEKFISLREEIEHKFVEWKKVAEEGEINEEIREKGIAEFEARLKIIRSGIIFYRERLEQLLSDCDLDLESIEKNLERLQKQKSAGLVDTKEANKIESTLFQAKLDIGRTKDTARRAISANSKIDIPSLRGTFVVRMGPTRGVIEVGVDSWLSWVCSALIIMLIMIPMTSIQGVVASRVLIIMVIGLFASALILAGVASIPYRRWRGIGLNILFLAYVTFYTIHVYIRWNHASPLGSSLRISPNGLLSFSVIAPYLVLLLLGLACWISLYKSEKLKFLPAVSTALSILIVVGTFSDFFGVIKGKAILESVSQTKYIDEEQLYEIEVSIVNNGLTSVWIGNKIDYVPRPIFVKVSLLGDDSKNFYPTEIIIDAKRMKAEEVFNLPSGKIRPGSRALIVYRLPPGSYIFTLDGQKGEFNPGVVKLELPVRIKSNNKNELKTLQTSKESNDSSHTEIDTSIAEVQTHQKEDDKKLFEELGLELNPINFDINTGEVIIYYHGFATTSLIEEGERKESLPKFKFTIWDSSKKSLDKLMVLGESLIGNWTISEFSPQRETITLKHENKIFIIKRGNYYKLRVD